MVITARVSRYAYILETVELRVLPSNARPYRRHAGRGWSAPRL
jgi:hypothetical protein